MERPTVLMIGFKPWRKGVKTNKSWQNIKDMDGAILSDLNVRTVQLPVDHHKAVAELRRAVDRIKPVVALAFGEDTKFNTGIRLERVFRPMNEDGEVVLDGHPRYSKLPISILLEVFQHHGWPCSLSSDAGGYVCERVGYELASMKGLQYHGFVHLPSFRVLRPSEQEIIPHVVLGVIRGVMRLKWLVRQGERQSRR